MTAMERQQAPESEIRTLFANWAKAVEAKDIDRITAAYVPGIVAFDAILALRFEGIDAYRAHWKACMEFCAGPMVFELHDLEVEASGDLGFCHGLVRCGGTGPDGQVMTGWTRMSAGLRRTNGGWRVVHEHFSVPFDMETGKALFELEPDRPPRALVA